MHKKEESEVVLRPYAVVDPGAVVVVPVDALVANVAVTRAGSSYRLTLWAKILRTVQLHEL